MICIIIIYDLELALQVNTCINSHKIRILLVGKNKRQFSFCIIPIHIFLSWEFHHEYTKYVQLSVGFQGVCKSSAMCKYVKFDHVKCGTWWPLFLFNQVMHFFVWIVPRIGSLTFISKLSWALLDSLLIIYMLLEILFNCN